MKTFSLIGAAGYIAPRHIRAVNSIGHQLVSAFDPVDSTNQVHAVFPNATIFTDLTLFEADFKSNPADYVVICSPSHLHGKQIAWALQSGADVICEKPLVLDPKELEHLRRIESETGRNVYTVLQMRLMDEVIKLKKKSESPAFRKSEISIAHITPRNEAYFTSWKGNEVCSGGLLTNIGIHLFDLLIWIFGPVHQVNTTFSDSNKAKGELILERANVSWFLSVDALDLPPKTDGFFRRMMINGEAISLESGLEHLHTRVYQQLLAGEAPGILDAYPSIQLCKELTNNRL